MQSPGDRKKYGLKEEFEFFATRRKGTRKLKFLLEKYINKVFFELTVKIDTLRFFHLTS